MGTAQLGERVNYSSERGGNVRELSVSLPLGMLHSREASQLTRGDLGSPDVHGWPGMAWPRSF